MPITYESIATQTLSSTASGVLFSSVPGTFTDLVVVCLMQSTSSANTDTRYQMYFNSDTATNYSTTYLNGNGVSASSSRDINRSQIDNLTPLSTTPEFTLATFNLFSYSNTSAHKTIIQRAGQQNNSSGAGAGNAMMGTAVSLYRSLSAITSIHINAVVNGQFVAGSTFALYGIKAA